MRSTLYPSQVNIYPLMAVGMLLWLSTGASGQVLVPSVNPFPQTVTVGFPANFPVEVGFNCLCNPSNCYEVNSEALVEGIIDFGDGTQTTFNHAWSPESCPRLPDPTKDEFLDLGVVAVEFNF